MTRIFSLTRSRSQPVLCLPSTKRLNQWLWICVLLVMVLTPAEVVPSGRASETTSKARTEHQFSGKSSGVLDGMVFSGPTGALGMGVDHQDTLVFSDGGFRSLGCETMGFRQNEYRANVVDGAIQFEAVNVSDKYGTMSWRGTIRDGKLEAHYVWKKERLLWDTQREYWFVGEISEKHDERNHSL